jgi:hypothetical protein
VYVERRTSVQPEIWSQRFTWRPAGVEAAFELDLPTFFATVLGGG